jgi:hypothetical protein
MGICQNNMNRLKDTTTGETFIVNICHKCDDADKYPLPIWKK